MDKSQLQQYGPWALIAGGSEGIGLCFAREVAAVGINLILLARRSGQLEAAREQLQEDFAVEVRTHAMDLTAADIDVELSAITAGLEIGLLIYNAGAMHGAGQFLDEPLEKSRKLVALNCNGPVTLCHHLAGSMRERKSGGIILLSSLSGLTGGAFVATYSATKAFDIALAESLWAELRPHGVHVLSLVAGATDTPAMAASGVLFEEGQAMDCADVAREGLAQLPHGPQHVAGEGNRMAAELLRGPDRRQSVALMTAGAAGLYGLAMPEIPVAGED
jgi:short-subunit dehydrogenase